MSEAERIAAMIPDGEALHAAFEVIITKRDGYVEGFPMFRTKVRGLLSGTEAEIDGGVLLFDLPRAIIAGARKLAEITESERAAMLDSVASPYRGQLTGAAPPTGGGELTTSAVCTSMRGV